jgi:hypothetical protein
MNTSPVTSWSASDYALIAFGALVVIGAIAFVVHSVSNRRAFERKLKEAQAGRHPFLTPRGSASQQISFDSVGFTVTDIRSKSQDTARMKWGEVVTAKVFKRDLFAVDCICLFLARADDTGIELNDEMDGWSALCDALPKCLPNCKSFDAWFWDVAIPAFEPNLRTIFDRNAVPLAASTSRRS